MTKQNIIDAITFLYPYDFNGFNDKLPTPRTYEEYVKSVDAQNKKLYTEKHIIHSEDELVEAAQKYKDNQGVK